MLFRSGEDDDDYGFEWGLFVCLVRRKKNEEETKKTTHTITPICMFSFLCSLRMLCSVLSHLAFCFSLYFFF